MPITGRCGELTSKFIKRKGTSKCGEKLPIDGEMEGGFSPLEIWVMGDHWKVDTPGLYHVWVWSPNSHSA